MITKQQHISQTNIALPMVTIFWFQFFHGYTELIVVLLSTSQITKFVGYTKFQKILKV